jgi:hypothetical protein
VEKMSDDNTSNHQNNLEKLKVMAFQEIQNCARIDAALYKLN